MRNFSLMGLLLTVAIVGWMAKGYFAPASHDPNDRSTIEYWVAHPGDRAAMLSYCNAHPQQQNGPDCQIAVAAQMRVDSEGQTGGGSSQGVDQSTSQASDQLQAQQDANSLDPGGQ